MSGYLKLALFAARWHELAAGAHCDTWGGAESRRVYAEWVAAGSPDTITAFILDRANVGSEDTEEARKYRAARREGKGVPDDAA